VLSQLPQYTWHVFWRPCKDVLILTEEAGELAFLFGREAGADDDELRWVALVQEDLLSIVGRLEMLHQGLANWHILLSQLHAVKELPLLLGDD
jgi:hypothetical protein